jgi:hypothetical protein
MIERTNFIPFTQETIQKFNCCEYQLRYRIEHAWSGSSFVGYFVIYLVFIIPESSTTSANCGSHGSRHWNEILSELCSLVIVESLGRNIQLAKVYSLNAPTIIVVPNCTVSVCQQRISGLSSHTNPCDSPI